MNMRNLLIASILLVGLVGCSDPEQQDYLQKYEGSYGGEDYVTYSLSLVTEELVTPERKTELIETGRFVPGLSDSDMDAFRFPIAVLGFGCDSREEGAVDLTYEYLQSDSLSNVGAGSYVPHEFTVDNFKRTIPIEVGMFIPEAHKSSVNYLFWDAEKAEQIVVETPVTPKTVHPIEKYRVSLSRLIRICRGFTEGKTQTSFAPIDKVLSLAHLPMVAGNETGELKQISDTNAAGYDCSLSHLQAGVKSRACSLRAQAHNHLKASTIVKKTVQIDK